MDAAFEDAQSRLAPSVAPARNTAKALALELWRAELGGYTELFLPVYCKALSGLGELIVQLAHESYCKSEKGQPVLFAEAPESQHHTNQRYFGGRRNMAALSVRVQSHENDMPLRGEVSAADFLPKPRPRPRSASATCPHTNDASTQGSTKCLLSHKCPREIMTIRLGRLRH